MGWALVLAAESEKGGGGFTDLKPTTAIWAWIAFLTIGTEAAHFDSD